LIRSERIDVTDDVGERLVAACRAPMAATASPVPVAEAGDTVVAVDGDDGLPPAPSIPSGCVDVCMMSVDALASVQLPEPTAADDVAAWLGRVCDELTRAGWRHVAAPGTAFGWSFEPRPLGPPSRIWSSNAAHSVVGPANEGLATHEIWSRTRLRPVSVVVDGACVTDGQHNGSQSVVIEVARALARRRPDAEIALAVRGEFVAAASEAVGAGVEVVERNQAGRRFDVVYRPYQLLDPHEVAWIERVGDRLMIGQLDMIAFSNPTYHPSPALFHAVRNLQRSTMRRADAVTFISGFGRETAFAECPDLDPDRLFVVSCGADPTPPVDDPATNGRELVGAGSFIVCMSATFSHKNRRHAIAVFAQLCRHHDYAGSLVLAGPEPYYGRSTLDEEQLIDSLDPNVGERVLRVGRVDERVKWWLLRNADLVLYPSVIEGFGLVPFEAAAVETPALSHGGSAVIEVLGAGPATVPSWSVDAWADSAARVLGDQTQAADVLDQIAAARALHTWDSVGDLTWHAINRTLARPRADRFDEEGAARSRVAGARPGVAFGALSTHFANRAVSYALRRTEGWRPSRPPE
jgi:glycosyltransferase involved in cell wall biosynthesis